MAGKKKLLAGLALGLCAAGLAGLGIWYGNTPEQMVVISEKADAASTLAGDLHTITAEEIEAALNHQERIQIQLADGSSTASSHTVDVQGNHVLITEGGIYELTGSLSEGQLEVNCKGQVALILNQVSISNTQDAALKLTDAESTIVYLKENTENTLISGTRTDVLTSASSGAESDEEELSGAALYARDDLVLAGNGSLRVGGYINNGISTTDNLLICGGNLEIEALNNGLRGKDGVVIEKGNIAITSGGDGVESEADLTIYDGIFEITAGNQTFLSSKKTEETGLAEGMPELPEGGQPEGMPELPGGSQPPEGMPQLPGAGQQPEDGQGFGRGQRPDGSQNFGGGQGFHKADQNNGEEQFANRPGKNQGEIGEGFLQQTSQDEDGSSKGIKCEGMLLIEAGDFQISSRDDCIHSNGSITINGGNLMLATADDGIHADQTLTIENGMIGISQSNEGLEAFEIRINGGDMSLNASDDGVNASGKSGSGLQLLEINGGTIYVNAMGDGLDSNGNLYVNGGDIVIDGPSDSGNGALDSGTESGGRLLSNGGTILAIGASGMAESFSGESAQCSFLENLSTNYPAGSKILITDEEGNVLSEHTSVKAFSSVVFSSPDLSIGSSYTLQIGEDSYTVEITELASGSSGAGGFGNRGGQGGRLFTK